MTNTKAFKVAIIGAGPAGLMAAEHLVQAGCQVTVYDAMPSAGRKLLQAGRGGFNLTHSEPFAEFTSRYGSKKVEVEQWLSQFNADDLRQWSKQLGIDTYIGSSGRIYPTSMQAAPFLRAWLHRLRSSGVHFQMRHRWLDWSEDGQLIFDTPTQQILVSADATLFALGGGSWPRLGSNGAWIEPFAKAGIKLQPLLPANCGFNLEWSSIFIERFAGQPLKNVSFSFTDSQGTHHQKLGEAMLTAYGIEGSLTYALSAPLRDSLLQSQKSVELNVDLLPDFSLQKLQNKLENNWAKKGKQSLSSFFKKSGVSALHLGLLREKLTAVQLQDMQLVAKTLKELPLILQSTRPIEEVISTAGGVDFSALTQKLMLSEKPGNFCAGEMLDWEAPTGGYLLTAVFASGLIAANGVIDYLDSINSN